MVFRAFEGKEQHLKSKERIIKLLTSRGFTCEKEVEYKDCETEVGARDYTADIVATLKIIVEVDGKTHWSKNAIHKDKIRDLYFKTFNTPTVRLEQNALTGKSQMPDSLVLAEFCHQIFGKGSKNA
jgi:hypothetical protein